LAIPLALDAASALSLIYAMIDRVSRSCGDGASVGRRLMRRCEQAALATSLRGAPYASLVLVAADLDASPLLLLSDLAQHSRNIGFDPRVSLLLDGTEGHADRLDGPRLSLLGRAERIADPRLLARFTTRHPSSARYAGFADFRIYRVVVERGHFVAGFGHIEWIDGADLVLQDDAGALALAEPAILAQLNEDDAKTADFYAQRLLGCHGDGWRITGIDPEGLDLRRETDIARLDFPAPAPTPEALRARLVQLAEKATQ
jgi:heme iron utilization protein